MFTWNLLLKKEILLKHPFPEFVTEYGYEDLIFIKNLQKKSVSISHIKNPLIHYNTENSSDFIAKTETALNNLNNLLLAEKLAYSDLKLSSLYLILKKTYLIGLVRFVYKKSKQKILTNLTSANPNLYLFDFYKLGYFCSLKK